MVITNLESRSNLFVPVTFSHTLLHSCLVDITSVSVGNDIDYISIFIVVERIE